MWEYRVNKAEFFVILGDFLPLNPPKHPQNQNFQIIKKASGDVIILLMGTKNHNHMMYASWDMYAYLTIDPKNKNLEKYKKTGRYYPFTHLYHKWRSYDIWFLRYKAWWTEFFKILGHFLPFHPPNRKIKFLKKWKKCLDILSFYIYLS